jgi:hypothetical protein
MGPQDHGVSIAVLIDKLGPCLNSESFVGVGKLTPLRFGDLHWMDYHIAGDNGVFAVRPEANATMPGRMTWCW